MLNTASTVLTVLLMVCFTGTIIKAVVSKVPSPPPPHPPLLYTPPPAPPPPQSQPHPAQARGIVADARGFAARRHVSKAGGYIGSGGAGGTGTAGAIEMQEI